MVQAPRGGPCLAVLPAAGERTEVVIGLLDQLMRQRGEQPAVLQTDRGPCFLGAEGSVRKALPGRLTLWLWGVGIHHRLSPPGKPYRNGAVERINGAVQRSWRGEENGLVELLPVWNYGKAPAAATAYAGRSEFSLERVWAGLEQAKVERSVDSQGKLSLWDRPLRVGMDWADRVVVVGFEADRRLTVIRDKRGKLVAEKALEWLTVEWLWAGTDADAAASPALLAPQALDCAGCSTAG